MGVSIWEGVKAERVAAALEEIADSVKRVKLTITMAGTNGNAVYDENMIVTDLATGLVLFTLPYSGAAVSIEVAQGKSISITGTQNNITTTKFYAPDTYVGVAQSDANITITYQVLDEANSLLAVQKAIQSNPGKEILPIGTEVTIPWTNEAGTEIDNTLVLVHYGYFVKEADTATGALTWMAIFMSKYAMPASLQFDAPEIEEATEATAATGLCYYGLNGSTYTKLALNQGDTIPYGDYEKVYHNELNDSTFNVIRYGYNRWSHSAYRQYLNSSAAKGTWWTAQHIGDSAPAQLESYRGYLAGWRTEDLSAVQSVRVATGKNTVTDDGQLEYTYDRIWLPSVKEMYGEEQIAGEGDVWGTYWGDFIGIAGMSNAANNLRKIYAVENHSSAQYVRLRSANRSTSNNVWFVNTSGQVSTNGGASLAYRSAPACAIG